MVDLKDGIENTISGPGIVVNVDPVVAARSGLRRRRSNSIPARFCKASLHPRRWW